MIPRNVVAGFSLIVVAGRDASRQLVAQATRPFGDVADSIVRARMAQHHVVGAALVVMERGRALKSAGYGLANKETNEPATPQTAFFVASIAKTVSTAAALKLVDDGRLSLDDSIGPIVAGLPQTWRPVTIRQLLGNTSGLPTVDNSPGVYVATWPAALEQLKDKPLVSAPGAQYRYIGTDWALLALAIRSRTGQAFEDYVASSIFRPLGLSSALFGNYSHVQKGRAEWYSLIVEPLTNPPKMLETPRLLRTEYPAYLAASNGLIISTEDLARFVDALGRGQLLKPATASSMWTNVKLSNGRAIPQGLGAWFVGELTQGTDGVVAEGGARSTVLHVRATGLTIALLTNTQGASEGDWVSDLLDVYLAKQKKP